MVGILVIQQPYPKNLSYWYTITSMLWLFQTLNEEKALQRHNVEVMVYQYDRFFGYGYWMTSIPTITHILIFCCILLGYCNIWIGCHANQLGNSKYPKNIKMWVMVRILVIHQPYPKSLSYWYTITSMLCWHQGTCHIIVILSPSTFDRT